MLTEAETAALLRRAANALPAPTPPVGELVATARRARARRRAGLGAAAALTVAAVVAAGPLERPAWFAPAPVATSAARLPGSDATPLQVVESYVAALNARDLTTARALVSPDRARRIESTQGGWFGFGTISDLRLSGPPRPEEPVNSQAQGYTFAVFVPVTLVASATGDLWGLPPEEGPMPWGYLLARNDERERWVIVDEGPV